MGLHVMDLRVVSLRRELPDFYRRLGYVETDTEPFPEEAKLKGPLPSCYDVEAPGG